MIDLSKHLDNNEKLVMTFRPSRKAYLFQYILYGIILIISIIILLASIGKLFGHIVGLLLMGFAMVMALRLEYRIWSRSYGVTNEKLLYSRGIFTEHFKSTRYYYITDISITQSLWDKIMNTGTLKVDTAGTDNYEIRYRKISDPFNVKKAINDLIPAQQAAATAQRPVRRPRKLKPKE